MHTESIIASWERSQELHGIHLTRDEYDTFTKNTLNWPLKGTANQTKQKEATRF